MHGGETRKRRAHANPEPHVPLLGAHLNTLACWDLESRPMQLPVQGAGMDARGWGYAPDLTIRWDCLLVFVFGTKTRTKLRVDCLVLKIEQFKTQVEL